MKKTYVSPSMLTVQLSAMRMMAESINSAPTPTVDTSSSADPGSFGTKGISDVNVWDNEW